MLAALADTDNRCSLGLSAEMLLRNFESSHMLKHTGVYHQSRLLAWVILFQFCRAMLCISAAIAVMRCPSVCLSVCLSRSWIMSKRINISSKFFSPSGSHTILIFSHQTGWRYSHGNPPNGGVECRWGIGRNRDSVAGYRRLLDVRSAKNIYRRRNWVYDTVGHAPLAIDRLLDVRNTKWQNSYRRPYLKLKQLIIKECALRFVLKLYRHEASRGLFATAELLVTFL